MNGVEIAVGGVASPMTYVGELPSRLRIQSLLRMRVAGGGVRNRVELYHGGRRWTVEWISYKVDPRLRRGELATVICPICVLGASGVIFVQTVLPA